jgi:hypothetical protein
MLLTVSGSRLVRRSDTVLPAVLNAVAYYSVVTVPLSAMTCLNLDGQYIGQYAGLGVGLEEAVEIRNILMFRYMWAFFGISFGVSIVRLGSGPARSGPFFLRRKPGPARPAGRPARADLYSRRMKPSYTGEETELL